MFDILSDPASIAIAVVVIIVLIVCSIASPKRDEYDPKSDPANMEVRTNADGSFSVYNFKTDEVIASFGSRSDADGFLTSLKAKN